jgi:streptomycin 6-kinase
LTSVRRRLESLRRRWRDYWRDADVDAMAAEVEERFERALEAWRLAEVNPLPSGQVALVCAARRADRAVVLKLNPGGHPEERQLAGEAAALRFWAASGTVPELLGARDGDLTILMERLEPGVELDAVGADWGERLTTLARLVARLHAAGPAPGSFEHLGAYVDDWRRALAPESRLRARLDELVTPSADDVLLHSDLHGGNALRHGGAWKVIDPKALRGDRHADVWALIDPLAPALPDEPAAAARTARRWLARYADAAGLDAGRAAEWTVLRARAEALMHEAEPYLEPEQRAWAGRLHRMADALT